MTKFRASTLEICHNKIEPLTAGFSEGICREANPRFSFLLDLDDSMFVKTSTPGEWIAQGDYYAKHQCWKVGGESACPGASLGLTSRSLQCICPRDGGGGGGVMGHVARAAFASVTSGHLPCRELPVLLLPMYSQDSLSF